jgi:HlyD family secretion protein
MQMAKQVNQSARVWLWLSAAVLLVVVFAVARYLMRDQLPVRAVEVQHQLLVNTVSTNGRVEPETNFQFYSPLTTTVKAVYVQPGDHVAAGKLLLQLDDSEARARVASAESGVKAAQAALNTVLHNGTQQEQTSAVAELAHAKLERDQAQQQVNALTKLVSTGAASTSEVATARDRLRAAEATLEAAEQNAKSRYSQADRARAQAALDDAEAALNEARKVEGQTAVHATAPGTVYTVDARPTELAEQGKLLLQMADLNHELVRAYFDEPEIGRLEVGQKIAIKWDAKPGQEWHGHILRTPISVIAYGTRNVGEVLVAIDDPDRGLLPNTNVTVTVTLASEPNALSMPRDALHSENGKYYVFKVVRNSLERTSVTIGSPTLTQVPVLTGLKEGDWVATVTTNGLPLQEDVPIKVVK